ncbi:MAG: PTS fructose transporter subunit IIA [Thermoanaerobaculia bacterium]|nr:PTS fructose transporter subunit IIA [Thermoanaerobaculia bacterium]
MVKTLIVTQGRLAEELLAAAEKIAGASPDVSALGLGWDDDPAEARTKVGAAIAELEAPDGVLVLTDMYGGTPYNVAAALEETGRVAVVTGVNLPMVLRLECMGREERPLEELADWIRAKGRRAICRCGAGHAALAASTTS